jgi:hypothetical protein
MISGYKKSVTSSDSGLCPIVCKHPEDMSSKPRVHFIKLVLPAPFCPKIANTPAAEISKSIPARASTLA